MSRLAAALSAAALLLAACSASTLLGGGASISIGAIYPLSGPQATGGREELGGLKAALEVASR